MVSPSLPSPSGTPAGTAAAVAVPLPLRLPGDLLLAPLPALLTLPAPRILLLALLARSTSCAPLLWPLPPLLRWLAVPGPLKLPLLFQDRPRIIAASTAEPTDMVEVLAGCGSPLGVEDAAVLRCVLAPTSTAGEAPPAGDASPACADSTAVCCAALSCTLLAGKAAAGDERSVVIALTLVLLLGMELSCAAAVKASRACCAVCRAASAATGAPCRVWQRSGSSCCAGACWGLSGEEGPKGGGCGAVCWELCLWCWCWCWCWCWWWDLVPPCIGQQAGTYAGVI